MERISPVEVIREAQGKRLFVEKGVPLELVLMPGLSTAEIEDLERSLPAPIPADVRELLAFCRGFEGPLCDVDFSGESIPGQEVDFMPNGHHFAADGLGNSWFVDLNERSTEWGPIYFACHDAPVILLQSANLTDFLIELFRMAEPPFKSLVDDVHQDRLFNVWRTNPGAMSLEEARSKEDGILNDFATDLGEGWSIIDLRGARPGEGFSWGRYGPKTEVRRYRDEPIFAYKKPPKKKFFGLFG